MSEAPGVLVRWSMPDPEQRALERVAAALGTTSVQLVKDAFAAFSAAGRPAIYSAPPPCPLDAQSLTVWRIVRWWLRRPPATAVLVPAALANETLTAARKLDIPGMVASQGQLARIAGDVGHPDREEARELLLSFIPKPQRTEMRDRLELALQLVTFSPATGKA